ncbi:MAG: response regulator [Saprospirales bacterium]|nr:MAG: response regulator [Saprospirales bacterium]
MKTFYFLVIGFLFSSAISLAGEIDNRGIFEDTDPLGLIESLEDPYRSQFKNYWQSRKYHQLSAEIQSILDKTQPELKSNSKILLTLQLFALIEDGQCKTAKEKLAELERLKGKGIGGFYCLQIKARVFSCLGEVEEAMSRIDSMHLFLDHTNYLQLFHFHETKAYFFRNQGMYDNKLEESKKALKYAEFDNHPLHKMKSLYHLGFVLAELRDYPLAIEYLQKGKELAIKQGNSVKLWRFTACEGICQVESGNYTEGRKLLEDARDLGYALGISLCCGNYAFLAKSMFMTGDTEEALQEAYSAWGAIENTDDLRDRRNVLHAIYDIFKSAGEYQMALEVGERLAQNKEALYQRNFDRMVAEMEVRFQVRENALALAERDQLLAVERAKTIRNKAFIWIGFGFSLLLMALLGLIYFHLRERKKIALELQNKNRELCNLDASKNKFFEDLSHEFRTPLTLIIGELEQLKSSERKPQALKRINQALRSSGRLKDLFTQILDISELKSNELEVTREMVKFKDWFEVKTASFQTLFDGVGAKIKAKVEIPSNLLISLDVDKIAKVVDNLIYNAYKHIGEKGEVLCSAIINSSDKIESEGSGTLEISISDNGPDITDELKDQIFKRRVKGELPTALIKGYGLGLSLSFELIEMMDGAISLNECQASGACFVLSLPVTFSKEVLVSSELSNSGKSQAVSFDRNGFPIIQKQANVLIVDDHMPTANYFSDVISEKYNNLVASNADEAWKILMERKVDLMLTDIQMNGMNGLSLIKKIRSSHTVFRHLPIVVVSGAAGQEDKLKGFEAGADEYLTKPISKKLLLTRIDCLLNQWQERSSLSFQSGLKNSDNEEYQNLKQAEEIILKNIGNENMSVKGLAMQLDVSSRTLERLFKKYLRISPASYIKKKRLEVAFQLLDQGRYSSVGEVREIVGIPNASYFSRAFRQKYGFNPSELLERKISTEVN